MFCYWDGNEKTQAKLRFGIYNQKNIVWNPGSLGVKFKETSDYSEKNSPWNIVYPENEKIQNNNEIYFTISVDCSKDVYMHTLYINGHKMYSGILSKMYWNNFVKYDLNNLKYFCIGRSSMVDEGWWHYSKMNAYSIKLYNRGLSAEEVKDNYNKAVAYHNAL